MVRDIYRPPFLWISSKYHTTTRRGTQKSSDFTETVKGTRDRTVVFFLYIYWNKNSKKNEYILWNKFLGQQIQTDWLQVWTKRVDKLSVTTATAEAWKRSAFVTNKGAWWCCRCPLSVPTDRLNQSAGFRLSVWWRRSEGGRTHEHIYTRLSTNLISRSY